MGMTEDKLFIRFHHPDQDQQMFNMTRPKNSVSVCTSFDKITAIIVRNLSADPIKAPHKNGAKEHSNR